MSRRLRLSLALSLLVPSIFGAFGTARAAFPGVNGRIAYQQDSAIATMQPDGTEQIVVPNIESGSRPVWAPDTTRLAFVDDGDIWVVNASGSGLRNLTNSPDFLDNEPGWSPDGTEIAFQSDRSGNTDVYVVRTSDGGAERRLTEDSAFDGYPVWSPDGDTIAFTTNRRLEYGIHAMPADDGDPESYIIPTSIINVNQAWFPDGSGLVYYNSGELWKADADGSNQTQLTTEAQNFFGLSVSPDGSKIAYTSGKTGNDEIWVVDADGSDPVNITNTPDVSEREPDWGSNTSDLSDPGTQQGTDGDDDLEGSPEADTVFAGDGDDVISTLGGNDTVFGEGGNDTIKGGGGNDKLYGDSGPSRGSARYALRPGLQEEPPAPPGNDELLGGGGSDVAVGGGGSDVLNGGPQVDSMKGGPGKDTCVYSHKKELKRDSGCEKKKLNFKLNFHP